MLSSKEKRFLKYWEEQRSGGKTSYITMLTVVGTFIGTLMISVFLFLFFHYTLSIEFLLVIASALVFSLVISWISWNRNEKKYQEMLLRS